MIAFSFWALTLSCCGYAYAAGGRDGRRIAVVYFAACLATVAAWPLQQSWRETHVATLIVDTALLAAVMIIAVPARRWFPLWFAGFHLVAVVSHLASVIAPGFAPKVYFLLQAFWSVPMLLVLATGVWLDRRAGLADDGPAARLPAG